MIPKLDSYFDLIFADPPYFLSSGGNTINSGKIVSVNKASWDKSKTIHEILKFNRKWLKIVRTVMKPDATIWVSGTRHNVFTVIQAMEELNYKVLNVITWQKTNPPPNFYTKIFKQSTEYIVFARKEHKTTHFFNYDLLKKINNGKRMTDVWSLPSVGRWEKQFGKHTTQKPLNILARIILAASRENNLILDPFTGSSTTGIAANLLNRRFVGVDIVSDYLKIGEKRRIDITNPESVKKYLKRLKDYKATELSSLKT